jgi:hypothetical protein
MKLLLWIVCCITAVISSVCFKLNKEVHYLRYQNIALKEKIERAEANAHLLKQYEIIFDSIEKSHPKIASKFDLSVTSVTPASHR